MCVVLNIETLVWMKICCCWLLIVVKWKYLSCHHLGRLRWIWMEILTFCFQSRWLLLLLLLLLSSSKTKPIRSMVLVYIDFTYIYSRFTRSWIFVNILHLLSRFLNGNSEIPHESQKKSSPNFQSVGIQSPCQRMIGVANHFRNARYLGSVLPFSVSVSQDP